MTTREERLKELAESVRKHSEKYGFPTMPKKNKKKKKKTE